MSFARPVLLALLIVAPVAALAIALLTAARTRAEAAWSGRALIDRLRAGGTPRPPWVAATVIALALAGLALALAEPRWGTATRTVERKGVDVVFVLDTSLSMAAGDVAPSRFWLARSLIRRMTAQLPGERVALVGAEGVGVVLTPLTVDAAVIDLLLDAVEPGTLPVPGTRLAPALDEALSLFPAGGRSHRALVLVSDGEDHGEKLDETLAALDREGVVVHAIGVGTAHGAPIPIAGRPGEVKRDRAGRAVVTRLESAPLRRLATATGGLYLEAADASAEPAAIVAAIGDMPARLHEAAEIETLEERFQWPLAAAAAALAWHLAFARRTRRTPGGRTLAPSGTATRRVA
jgi:Ca-activated chloride channel family protein